MLPCDPILRAPCKTQKLFAPPPPPPDALSTFPCSLPLDRLSLAQWTPESFHQLAWRVVRVPKGFPLTKAVVPRVESVARLRRGPAAAARGSAWWARAVPRGRPRPGGWMGTLWRGGESPDRCPIPRGRPSRLARQAAVSGTAAWKGAAVAPRTGSRSSFAPLRRDACREATRPRRLEGRVR